MKQDRFSRKSFLQKGFRTGAIVSLAPLVSEIFAYGEEDAVSFRENPILYAEKIGLKRPIEKIILTATLAPNSHNTQPWKIKIESDSSFLLYGDPKRQLLSIDPVNRQFYHTQGCFLELAKLAADSLMFDAKINLFPKGIDSVSKTGSSPVAEFRISPKDLCVHDFLFPSLPKRQMNRSVYSGDWITKKETDKLLHLTNASFLDIRFVLGKKEIESFLPTLQNSFAQETNLTAQNEVTRVWFRKSKEEIYSKRDGLTLEGNGISGIKGWAAKKFFLDLSYDGWHSEASKAASIDLFKNQSNSSKGLVFFVTKGKDDAKEWVKTGMDFMRFTLACAGENIAFHTMNQALEDYPESLVFHEEIKSLLGLKGTERVQLLGRLGRSSYKYDSTRRGLEEILI
ncbi:Acg family FMN-binding oxidoreductase [Leptospira idonii]|uniref:Nitroreductase n=1 Tax=Leptospira idonii TaxID=1193500 RepID=A0A4V3JYF3_9LEPT|nr:hypothetical protein [Leptospira idonii]TGN20886.1 hypothetical protein EHS15_01475 [Leptospira idonii]